MEQKVCGYCWCCLRDKDGRWWRNYSPWCQTKKIKMNESNKLCLKDDGWTVLCLHMMGIFCLANIAIPPAISLLHKLTVSLRGSGTYIYIILFCDNLKIKDLNDFKVHYRVIWIPFLGEKRSEYIQYKKWEKSDLFKYHKFDTSVKKFLLAFADSSMWPKIEFSGIYGIKINILTWTIQINSMIEHYKSTY